MTDPLHLLRQATVNKTPISWAEGYYDFGHVRLPETAKTCFKRTLKNDDYCYTLLDIMYFWENVNLSLAEYRRKVVEAKRGVTAVTEPDRQSLQQYISGEIETCSQIDTSLLQNINTLPSTSGDSAMQAKLTKPKDSKRHESDERVEKTTEKVRKDHKRKLEHVATNSTDKVFIDADKSILSAIRAGEFAPYTRNSLMNTDQQKVDFSSVLKLFNDSVLKQKESKGDIQSNSIANNSSIVIKPALVGSNRPSGAPMIIVPKALTSDINICNIKEFLERGKFSRVVQSQNRPKFVNIERISPVDGAKRLHYKVLDDPSGLNPEDWSRVVAVFVSGQDWQFRGWKYSDPVNLFQHSLGVYIAADERAPDAKVSTWNCRILKVNSVKDHVTTSASKDFWAMLDNFVKFHNPQFDPSKL